MFAAYGLVCTRTRPSRGFTHETLPKHRCGSDPPPSLSRAPGGSDIEYSVKPAIQLVPRQDEADERSSGVSTTVATLAPRLPTKNNSSLHTQTGFFDRFRRIPHAYSRSGAVSKSHFSRPVPVPFPTPDTSPRDDRCRCIHAAPACRSIPRAPRGGGTTGRPG